MPVQGQFDHLFIGRNIRKLVTLIVSMIYREGVATIINLIQWATVALP